jgi:FkbM family methyltransferase
MWRVPKLIYMVSRGHLLLTLDLLGLRKSPYLITLRNGIVIELRPGTSDWWIFLEVFLFKHYSPCYDQLRRSSFVLDIGANAGFFSLLATTINPKASVAAFEPFPPNYTQLQRNLLLNPKARVAANPEAVSDLSGNSPIHFTPGDESGCSLRHSGSQAVTVNVMGIKEVYAWYPNTDIDLLKMDCEGSEYPIIKAMSAATLQRTRSIIMEYHDSREMTEMAVILETAGLHCVTAPTTGMLYATRS